MKAIINYIGIDISKSYFDVAFYRTDRYVNFKFSNDLEGFKLLIKQLGDSKNFHLVMEASGPYYLHLAHFFYEHGFTISVVNPLVIRRFCQMRLSRAKTDKKDAVMIAEYGQVEHPQAWVPAPMHIDQLRQMQAASDLLNKNKTNIERQVEAFKHGIITDPELIHLLKKEVERIEKKILFIEEKMQSIAEEYYPEMMKNLKSIPGIGKKTALLLIVISNGFKKFSNAKQLSSYVGLSPRIFESGTSVKGRSRITKMGMSRIRTMLYVCSWSAKKCNKTCKDLYDRLVAAGKSKRLALIAVANKLLKQAFSIAINKRIFLPDYSK